MYVFLYVVNFTRYLNGLVATKNIFRTTIGAKSATFRFFGDRTLGRAKGYLGVSLATTNRFGVFGGVSIRLGFSLYKANTFYFMGVERKLLPSFLFLPYI